MNFSPTERRFDGWRRPPFEERVEKLLDEVNYIDNFWLARAILSKTQPTPELARCLA